MRLLRFIKALWKYILYGNRVGFSQYMVRLYMCERCACFREDNWTCGVCGCYVTKKAKMSTEKCPKSKW